MTRPLPGLFLALAVSLVLAACGGGEAADPSTAPAPDAPGVVEGTAASETAAADDDGMADAAGGEGDESPGSVRLSPEELAARTEALPTALDVPEFRDGPQPIAISFPSIGVDGAPIDGVGVEPNGELEVPEALRVGWYEYGPSPGQVGSSVLAGHIAADGIDGAFRNLADAEVGDVFEVEYRDGTRTSFAIIEMAQYDKNELPLQRVFARDGRPIVTLITCGGAFQPSLRSYEDNIVAYAVAVDA